METVICKNCKWVHFDISLEYVQAEVNKFNEFFKKQTKKVKDAYGGKPSSIDDYTSCFRCGGSYKNFRKAKKSEIPYGSTIQPVLNRKENV